MRSSQEAAAQVAIVFASGAHASFDQLAEASARLRTHFPSLQHIVGTAVCTQLCTGTGGLGFSMLLTRSHPMLCLGTRGMAGVWPTLGAVVQKCTPGSASLSHALVAARLLFYLFSI